MINALVLSLVLAAPGWFGLSFSFHRNDDTVFLRLCSVAPNGPAAAAGLRAGDLITHIDGKPVAFAGTQAALRHFAKIRPKDRVRFRIARGAHTFDVVVVTASRRR